MTSYQAKFAAESGTFHSTALAWDGDGSRCVPAAWWPTLRSAPAVDAALRLPGGKPSRTLLLLTAEHPATLESVTDRLMEVQVPGKLQRAENSEQYDALSDPPLPEAHLRVRHDGYHRDGHALGCDFRLYGAWSGGGQQDGVDYQVCLRSNPPTPEQERQVRKYLAWLELEQPFSPPVRELQGILSRRLLEPSWLADEYLLFDSAERCATWEERIHGQFADTTGRIGFPVPPIECGDYSEWLISGSHSTRDEPLATAAPVLGAHAFSEGEIAWLFAQRPGADEAIQAGEPEVFISYASADFAEADAVRQHLENGGRRCWIAPRDINSGGLPYTEAIPQAIRQVRTVIVLLSPSANLSVHIPRELDLALASHHPIIPLRLEAIEPGGQLEYLLRTCQWLNLFDRSRPDAMGELDQRLRELDRR